jgi:predicted nucleic acid-binding protein
LPEVISNTSPLQYLYQLGLLDLLPKLVGQITVPPGVVEELEAGHVLGLDLPDISAVDWIIVRAPGQSKSQLPVADLGPGETEVLLLGLESTGEVVLILDDAQARKAAEAVGLKFTGTLGVLLDAKRAGLLQTIKPELDRLDALGFRLAHHTRDAVLRLAGEAA